MTSQEILNILKQEKNYLQREFGVISIGLFGSHVTGTQKPDSDVDLLVELVEPRFDYLAGLQIHLERKIGKPIELVRKRSGMSERFLNRIKEQVCYA